MNPVGKLGKYILLERIAAGGMAEVFLAKSPGAAGISRFVAIKSILPQYSDNTEFIEMFKEEAKIVVNLNHRNIVSIFDFGIEKNQFYLVMEFVEGQNLRQVLNHLRKEGKNFSMDQIVYIMKEVIAGLDHAHRCIDGSTGRPLNIIHRDMSPQNIMISYEGEVKVVDFGIAKAENQIEHTRAGTIKGKFGYMSPEQADGQQIDIRTDIFSVGIVLWELLAQERLFTGSSEAATLKKIRECEIPNLRKINPQVPVELERICSKALARDPSLRYQTAAAFHKDLNRFLNTQYPEFSPQDFSIFMKSAFAQIFLDLRKKMVAFSTNKNENTQVTSTHTVTTSEVETKPDQDFEGPLEDPLKVAPNPGKVNLSALKIDNKNLARQPVPQNTTMTRTSNRVSPHTRTGIKTSQSSPVLSYVAFALVVLGLVYWFQEELVQFIPGGKVSRTTAAEKSAPVESITHDSPTPPPQEGHIESSSVQMVVVTIESEPLGARVIIDGQDTGMITPTRRSLPANKPFQLRLEKVGFTAFDNQFTVTENASTIKPTLSREPEKAVIRLDLINGGNNPAVMINGALYNGDLSRIVVPANMQVRIEVKNDFTQLKAESIITLKPQEKRTVQLILKP